MARPLDPASRKKIAAAASKLLADSYTLYLKTHNYHWNVKGPMFTTLHTLFELVCKGLANVALLIPVVLVLVLGRRAHLKGGGLTCTYSHANLFLLLVQTGWGGDLVVVAIFFERKQQCLAISQSRLHGDI